jgi:succinylarginine dihydrolase
MTHYGINFDGLIGPMQNNTRASVGNRQSVTQFERMSSARGSVQFAPLAITRISV